MILRESTKLLSYAPKSGQAVYILYLSSLQSHSLPSETSEIEELQPHTATLQKTEIRSLAFSEGGKKKKNTAIKVTK